MPPHPAAPRPGRRSRPPASLAALTAGVGIGVLAALPLGGGTALFAVLAIVAASAAATVVVFRPSSTAAMAAADVVLGIAVLITVFGGSRAAVRPVHAGVPRADGARREGAGAGRERLRPRVGTRAGVRGGDAPRSPRRSGLNLSPPCSRREPVEAELGFEAVIVDLDEDPVLDLTDSRTITTVTTAVTVPRPRRVGRPRRPRAPAGGSAPRPERAWGTCGPRSSPPRRTSSRPTRQTNRSCWTTARTIPATSRRPASSSTASGTSSRNASWSSSPRGRAGAACTGPTASCGTSRPPRRRPGRREAGRRDRRRRVGIARLEDHRRPVTPASAAPHTRAPGRLASARRFGEGSP